MSRAGVSFKRGYSLTIVPSIHARITALKQCIFEFLLLVVATTMPVESAARIIHQLRHIYHMLCSAKYSRQDSLFGRVPLAARAAAPRHTFKGSLTQVTARILRSQPDERTGRLRVGTTPPMPCFQILRGPGSRGFFGLPTWREW